MKKRNVRRYFLLAFTSLLTVSVLTACGGGGGSSSGGGSASGGSATLSGNVDSLIASNYSDSSTTRILAALLNAAISDANAAGVGGVNVDLLKDGAVIERQTTNTSGDFEFTGLFPGDYSVRLSQDGQYLGDSRKFQLEANTHTRMRMGMNGNMRDFRSEAQKTEPQGPPQGQHEDEAPHGVDVPHSLSRNTKTS